MNNEIDKIVQERQKEIRAKHAKNRKRWMDSLSDEGIQAKWKKLATEQPNASIKEIKEQVQRNRIQDQAGADSQPQTKVQLWYGSGLGLIIPFPSGIIYSNQTGGCGCNHPEMEGLYIPIEDDLVDQQKQLFDHFTGPKWGGWCTSGVGIDEETAQFIDQVLAESDDTQMIQVDHSMLPHSHEAWVYVDIDTDQFSPTVPVFEDPELRWGVLTWQNSD